jgi:nitrogen regulatory protein PII-like uncharacterized protein
MTVINPSKWEASIHATQKDGHAAFEIQGPQGNLIWASIESKTGTIREIAAIDAKLAICYQWVNPSYETDREFESTRLRPDMKWVGIEVQEDIDEKVSAIKDGAPYDSRVIIQINLTDEETLLMMRKAHELDITFNKYVEMILQEVIDKHKKELEKQG